MTKKIFPRIMLVGRAVVFMVGLAAVLFLTLAVVADAADARVPSLKKGVINAVSSATTLVGDIAYPIVRLDNDGAGTALDLQVEPGNAPMTVNSSAKVANLNADQLDGKDVSQIGVNGRQVVQPATFANSASPKSSTATCPSGKVLVGTGVNITGGKSGASPDLLTDVVINQIQPETTSVTVEAIEEDPTNDSWGVEAIAICATAP
jgi:hypothetical protein